MKIAPAPIDEDLRLRELRNLRLFNSEAEESFDNITQLASFICKTPIALISLIGQEKQYLKSRVGTDVCEGARDISHCSHAILTPEKLMEVEDTRKDVRFADNPYTHGEPPLLYYAGMPLRTSKGAVLGTLCVLDTKPNKLNKTQKAALLSLAKQVESLFELRRYNEQLEEIRTQLKFKNTQLKNFASTVSHDMKMPLANIILTADLLKAKYSEKLDEDGKEYLEYLKHSSYKLSNYITGILEHYESDSLKESDHEKFDIEELLEQILDLLNINYDCEINLPETKMQVNCNRAALEQIFMNLLGNALKYSDKDKTIIDIECHSDNDFYYFSIKDNGMGIPKDKQDTIFELFTVVADTDRNGNKGNGIGLSTVKKLIESFEGEISVESQVKKGTTFKFSIKKNC
ncbi:MAG: GAF domain-containing sensor histidine kinase [Gillisia sp.]